MFDLLLIAGSALIALGVLIVLTAKKRENKAR